MSPKDHHPAGTHRYVARGAVTGIGSLPLTNPDEAVAFVETHSPELPLTGVGASVIVRP
jgi:hypothetical protein